MKCFRTVRSTPELHLSARHNSYRTFHLWSVLLYLLCCKKSLRCYKRGNCFLFTDFQLYAYLNTCRFVSCENRRATAETARDSRWDLNQSLFASIACSSCLYVELWYVIEGFYKQWHCKKAFLKILYPFKSENDNGIIRVYYLKFSPSEFASGILEPARDHGQIELRFECLMPSTGIQVQEYTPFQHLLNPRLYVISAAQNTIIAYGSSTLQQYK